MATGTIQLPNSDTGWINVNSTGTIKYRIKDRIVYLTIDNYNMVNSSRDIISLPSVIWPANNINPFCRAQYDIVQCWISASDGLLNIQSTFARQGVAGFAIYPI